MTTSTEPADRRAAAAAGQARDDDTSPDGIHDRIYARILEHRLPPGTKLGEERLGQIFGVSRMRIRAVLARLAHEHIVEVVPNRGAFVARPTVDQAREVFQARRVVEPGIMRMLAARRDPATVASLAEHVRREIAAHDDGDTPAAVRLSGEFHTVAADLAGNATLARTVRELTALTRLVIILYEAPTSDSCRVGEHREIVDALADGDADAAAACVVRHLDAVEAGIRLDAGPRQVDLESVFAD